MNKIAINENEILTASEWNELSCDEFKFYAKLILKKANVVHAKLLMISYLMGAKAWTNFKKLFDEETHRLKSLLMKDTITIERYNELSEELNCQLYFLQNSVNFLWDDIKLTKWKVPVIGKEYYGPSDEMRNSSFHEFAKADGHFIKYMKSNDVKELDLLIACLFRKAKAEINTDAIGWNGDMREKFNEHTVSARADKLSHIHGYLKHAILTNYIGVRSFIVGRHPHVFVKNEGSKKEPDPYGLLKIIPALGRILQNEVIASSELYTVLYDMEMSEIDRIKAEAEAEKLRKKNR